MADTCSLNSPGHMSLQPCHLQHVTFDLMCLAHVTFMCTCVSLQNKSFLIHNKIVLCLVGVPDCMVVYLEHIFSALLCGGMFFTGFEHLEVARSHANHNSTALDIHISWRIL